MVMRTYICALFLLIFKTPEHLIYGNQDIGLFFFCLVWLNPLRNNIHALISFLFPSQVKECNMLLLTKIRLNIFVVELSLQTFFPCFSFLFFFVGNSTGFSWSVWGHYKMYYVVYVNRIIPHECTWLNNLQTCQKFEKWWQIPAAVCRTDFWWGFTTL